MSLRLTCWMIFTIDSIAASIGLTAGSNILLIAFSLSRGYGMSLTSTNIPCHQKCVFNGIESLYQFRCRTNLLVNQIRTPTIYGEREHVFNQLVMTLRWRWRSGTKKTPKPVGLGVRWRSDLISW